MQNDGEGQDADIDNSEDDPPPSSLPIVDTVVGSHSVVLHYNMPAAKKWITALMGEVSCPLGWGDRH